jgi:hypothetical protein
MAAIPARMRADRGDAISSLMKNRQPGLPDTHVTAGAGLSPAVIRTRRARDRKLQRRADRSCTARAIRANLIRAARLAARTPFTRAQGAYCSRTLDVPAVDIARPRPT